MPLEPLSGDSAAVRGPARLSVCLKGEIVCAGATRAAGVPQRCHSFLKALVTKRTLSGHF